MIKKVWFAAPKKGTANLLNVIRVSKEGALIDFVWLFSGIMLGTRTPDYIAPAASFWMGVLLAAAVSGGVLVIGRVLLLFLFKDRIDFKNPYTNYNGGELLTNEVMEK